MELRKYKRGDEEGIFELWHKIFGSLLDKNDVFRIGPEWWSWRILNPEGFPDIYLAFSDSGEIVAHQMAEAFNLVTPEGERRIYLSGNTMSDEQHRGLVLLKLLGDCTKKIESENSLGYGLPNENSLSIFEKFNWKYIGNIPILIRPITLPFRIFDLKSKEKELEIKKIERFDKKIDEFMESNHFGFDYYMDRNHEILNWRYADAIKKYEKRILLRNDEIKGYAVFRKAKITGIEAGIILDIFATDERGFGALLDEIINYFSKEKAHFVSSFMINNNFFYKVLKRRGFIKLPAALLPKRNALVILDKKNEQKLLNIKKWYISYGDWDCF